MAGFTATYGQSWEWVHRLSSWLVCIFRTQPPPSSWQAQQLDLAFHQTYRRFAQTHAAWVHRRFDEDFLRQHVTKAFKPRQDAIVLPTGAALALAWDRHFGVLASDAGRVQQLAELTAVANHFLCLLEQALQPPAQETCRKSRFVVDQGEL